MKAIRCTNCGAPIESKNISAFSGKAVCSHCGTVLQLQPGGSPRTGSTFGGGPRPAVLPKGVTMEQQDSDLLFRKKWLKAQLIVLLLFCIMWDLFLILWFTLSIRNGAGVFALFGILHAGVGLGLTYYVVAGFFNTTTIKISRTAVEISHAPFPWIHAGVFNRENIAYLEYQERTSSSGSSSRSSSAPGTFQLYLFLKDGSKIPLFNGIPTLRQVQYLQSLIEKTLG